MSESLLQDVVNAGRIEQHSQDNRAKDELLVVPDAFQHAP